MRQPFDNGNLHLLLTNPIVTGKAVHKGEAHPGVHEAIVAPDLFAKVQARLKANGRAKMNTIATGGALLKGLLRCKACDSAMVHSISRRGTRAYRYYACSHGARHGRGTCPSGSLPAGEIERVVVEEVTQALNSRVFVRDTVRAAKAHATEALARLQRDRDGQTTELRRHQRELNRLAKDPGGGARIAEVGIAVARAEERIRTIDVQMAGQHAAVLDEAAVRAAFADFNRLWQELPPAEQSRLLHLAVERVESDAGTSAVSVQFRAGLVEALAEARRDAA